MVAKKARKPREAAPKDETKAARFVRLGNARLKKTVKSISLMGNLSGSGYEYTTEQVDKIKTALESAVEDTISKFQPKEHKERNIPSL